MAILIRTENGFMEVPSSTNVDSAPIENSTYPVSSGGVFAVTKKLDDKITEQEIRKNILPTANADNLGKIYQYTGTTTETLTRGFFYICEDDGEGGYKWNVLDVEPDSAEPTQYETMPTAEADREGEIIQYIGETDTNYTNGYFYKCVYKNGAWTWVNVEVQTGSSGVTKAGKYKTVTYKNEDNVNPVILYFSGIALAVDYGYLSFIIRAKGGETYLFTTGDIDNRSETNNYQITKLGYGFNKLSNFKFLTNTTGGFIHGLFFTCDGGTSVTIEQIAGKAVNSNPKIELVDAYPDTNLLINLPVAEIGENGQTIQYDVMPTAGAAYVDKIIQYIGADTEDYKNGYFYKCISATIGSATVYTWVRVDVQPGGGGSADFPAGGTTGQALVKASDTDNDVKWGDVSDKIQVTILPTASEDNVGKIYQYIGNTTNGLNNGWFYKCIYDEENEIYYWSVVEQFKVATDNTVGVVKPDNETITIDPDGTIHALGGGGGIHLGNVSGATAVGNKETVLIKWSDPPDIVVSGIPLATWAGTKVLKKSGSAPTSIDDEDATILVDSTTRDAYASTPFVDDDVEYGVTYYYKFFPYTSDDVVTNGICLGATPSRIVIDTVPTQNGTITYNGESNTPSWNGYNEEYMTIAGDTSGTDVGTYTVSFTPKSDYEWWDGTQDAKSAIWKIERIVIATVPSQNGELNYTGSEQIAVWNNYNPDQLTVTGNTGTEIGTYTATFTPKANHEWWDGSTGGKTADWIISESIITAVPTQQGTLTYDGTEQTAVWNNFNTDELTIANGTGINAGTYTASFTPKSGYKWSDGTTTAKTADFVIGKANGNVTLSADSVTLDDNSSTATITLTDATGNISVSSNDTTIATADYSNGVITITSPNEKKGNTAVTVNVAESANYLGTNKTISVTADFIVYGSWSESDDATIAAMVAAADAGTLDLSLYWAVGDERTVHLSAMTAGNGLNNAQPEQDVVLVLMNEGYPGNPNVNFVWGQKDCLSEKGRMNTSNTNTGSWNGCAMRTDLNNKYYNALPATFRSCLKQFNVITAQTYNGSTNQTSQDYISLFAEKEVFGTTTYSNTTEAAASSQIEYYKTTSNRIKQINGSNYYWWERSPRSNRADNFCNVASDGSADNTNASSAYGVAPFGCI